MSKQEQEYTFETFEKFMSIQIQKYIEKMSNELVDDIEEPHIFVVFQMDEIDVSEIHICGDIEGVKKMREEHYRTKYLRAKGGDSMGLGKFAYFPILV